MIRAPIFPYPRQEAQRETEVVVGYHFDTIAEMLADERFENKALGRILDATPNAGGAVVVYHPEDNAGTVMAGMFRKLADFHLRDY